MKKKELKAKIERLERDIYLLIREPESKEAIDARWLHEFNYDTANVVMFGSPTMPTVEQLRLQGFFPTKPDKFDPESEELKAFNDLMRQSKQALEEYISTISALPKEFFTGVSRPASEQRSGQSL